MLIKIHAMKIKEAFEIFLHYRHGGLPALSFLLSLRSESYFFIPVLQDQPAGPDNPVLVNLTSPPPLLFICLPDFIAVKGTGNNLDEFRFPLGKPTDSRKHPLRNNFWRPVLMAETQI